MREDNSLELKKPSRSGRWKRREAVLLFEIQKPAAAEGIVIGKAEGTVEGEGLRRAVGCERDLADGGIAAQRFL